MIDTHTISLSLSSIAAAQSTPLATAVTITRMIATFSVPSPVFRNQTHSHSRHKHPPEQSMMMVKNESLQRSGNTTGTNTTISSIGSNHNNNNGNKTSLHSLVKNARLAMEKKHSGHPNNNNNDHTTKHDSYTNQYHYNNHYYYDNFHPVNTIRDKAPRRRSVDCVVTPPTGGLVFSNGISHIPTTRPGPVSGTTGLVPNPPPPMTMTMATLMNPSQPPPHYSTKAAGPTTPTTVSIFRNHSNTPDDCYHSSFSSVSNVSSNIGLSSSGTQSSSNKSNSHASPVKVQKQKQQQQRQQYYQIQTSYQPQLLQQQQQEQQQQQQHRAPRRSSLPNLQLTNLSYLSKHTPKPRDPMAGNNYMNNVYFQGEESMTSFQESASSFSDLTASQDFLNHSGCLETLFNVSKQSLMSSATSQNRATASPAHKFQQATQLPPIQPLPRSYDDSGTGAKGTNASPLVEPNKIDVQENNLRASEQNDVASVKNGPATATPPPPEQSSSQAASASCSNDLHCHDDSTLLLFNEASARSLGDASVETFAPPPLHQIKKTLQAHPLKSKTNLSVSLTSRTRQQSVAQSLLSQQDVVQASWQKALAPQYSNIAASCRHLALSRDSSSRSLGDGSVASLQPSQFEDLGRNGINGKNTASNQKCRNTQAANIAIAMNNDDSSCSINILGDDSRSVVMGSDSQSLVLGNSLAEMMPPLLSSTLDDMADSHGSSMQWEEQSVGQGSTSHNTLSSFQSMFQDSVKVSSRQKPSLVCDEGVYYDNGNPNNDSKHDSSSINNKVRNVQTRTFQKSAIAISASPNIVNATNNSSNSVSSSATPKERSGTKTTHRDASVKLSSTRRLAQQRLRQRALPIPEEL